MGSRVKVFCVTLLRFCLLTGVCVAAPRCRQQLSGKLAYSLEKKGVAWPERMCDLVGLASSSCFVKHHFCLVVSFPQIGSRINEIKASALLTFL